MSSRDHYQGVVSEPRTTRLVRCGYIDRFDPFRLNASARIDALYDGLFRRLTDGAVCPHLLDIGCGTGIYFDALSRNAKQVDAIDISIGMIRVARKYCAQRGLAHFKCGVASAARLPFPEALFDAVIAMDLFHHVDSVEAVLDEVYRVMKPNGRLLVFEPNILNPAMFLAHALPKEERHALRRCRPGRLLSLLGRRFETLHWFGVCQMITDATGLRRHILNAYLWPFERLGVERLYPRQAWIGVKRG